MIVMSEKYLRSHWAKEDRIRLRGQGFRVERMSYGDYFLEPGKPKGETKPFNQGTIWPERIPKTENYKV